MKKVVGIFVSLMLVVFLQPTIAQAEDQKVLAIIDTAIDSNKNLSVIHEVCITTRTVNDPNRYCPNGTQFQEGRGAANVRDWTIRGIDHGYNITQVANQVAPDVKIVFIRISEITSAKTAHNHGQSLATAVKWVSDNASRFGIDALSISQSRSNFTAGTCPVDRVLESGVQGLKAQGITVYAATGNEGKADMVGFPACVQDVVGVGATRPDGTLASYTNRGPGMDVTFRGDANVKHYRGHDITITGTSVASPGFAAVAVNTK